MVKLRRFGHVDANNANWCMTVEIVGT